MDRTQAERIIQSWLKPIYGFALKRCAYPQDAEDLTQEISLRAFRALTIRDDIDNVDKYIWTIAHNALANHYRSRSHTRIGSPVDEIADRISDGTDPADSMIERERVARLQREIAYLSKTQRQIVIAYYYENRRQSEIADVLGIPVGTVKWHLFEAKKELKRGMDTMRKPTELKFNPVRFSICGTNGSVGTMGGNYRFFRSALAQNIAYAAYRTPMSANELADALGISPVYIESEAEYLAEYGFMLKESGKYLTNILIDENTPELTALHNAMYSQAAVIFANELYDELTSSGILDDPDISCGIRDRNYLLWALIPYIAAQSGEHMMDNSISFDDAATLRPDGGHNICYAMIETAPETQPIYMDSMQKWCGPCWNANEKLKIWLCDSEWSESRMTDSAADASARNMQLLAEWNDGGDLSGYDTAYLIQQGYLMTDANGSIVPGCLWIGHTETVRKLLEYGDRIRESHAAEFDALKKPYVKAVLDSTPSHMRKTKMFGMQYIFFADGWFILNCLKTLVENGRLTPPEAEFRRSLSMIILPA